MSGECNYCGGSHAEGGCNADRELVFNNGCSMGEAMARNACEETRFAQRQEIDRLTLALSESEERGNSKDTTFTGKQVADAIHAQMAVVPNWDHPNDTEWLKRMVIERLYEARALNDLKEPKAKETER